MKSIRHQCPYAAIFLLTIGWQSAGAEFPSFECHEIGDCGNRMGQTSLVDVDRDGDLDWVVGMGSGGDIWWFEYRAADDWVRHRIGGRSPTDVGGTAFDIDGDGWIDQVCGGAWYRNPGGPRSREFIRYDNGAISTHDNVAADIDGDGRPDVVAMSDKQGLFWYAIPDDPTKQWRAHRVGDGVHGGVGPRGVGDLDGDGDQDLVRTNMWLENADGKGTRWVEHKTLDFGRDGGRFPLTTKSWIIDLDCDGDNDVVMTECDLPEGRVAWFENSDGKGRGFVRHVIAETDQDLHSLAVADFDLDGDADVFSGGGPLTPGSRQWCIWENADGRGGRWPQHVILRDKRCHESVAADVDRDGDIDICSKPWNGSLHVFLENTLKRR